MEIFNSINRISNMNLNFFRDYHRIIKVLFVTGKLANEPQNVDLKHNFFIVWHCY